MFLTPGPRWSERWRPQAGPVRGGSRRRVGRPAGFPGRRSSEPKRGESRVQAQYQGACGTWALSAPGASPRPGPRTCRCWCHWPPGASPPAWAFMSPAVKRKQTTMTPCPNGPQQVEAYLAPSSAEWSLFSSSPSLFFPMTGGQLLKGQSCG